MTIVWTDYLKYKAKLRSFDLDKIENIIGYSSERYSNTTTGCRVVVGQHDKTLVMIPYEVEGD